MSSYLLLFVTGCFCLLGSMNSWGEEQARNESPQELFLDVPLTPDDLSSLRPVPTVLPEESYLPPTYKEAPLTQEDMGIQKELDPLNKLNKAINKKKFYRQEKTKKKFTPLFASEKEILTSGTTLVFVPKGAAFLNYGNGTITYSKKDMHLYVYNKMTGKNHFVLSGAYEQGPYLIHESQAVKIKDVTELDPLPGSYETYSPDQSKDKLDKKFPLMAQASVAYEVAKSNVVNSVLFSRGVDDQSLTHSWRYEALCWANWKFFIRPGLLANLQRGAVAVPGEDEAEVQALYLGLALKTTPFEMMGALLQPSFSFQKAYYYELTTYDRSYKLSAEALQLSLESLWKLGDGTLTVAPGLRFEQQNLKNNTQDLPEGKDNSDTTSRTLGLYIGYIFPWNI